MGGNSNSKSDGPDVLACIANLSEDDIFTSPDIANDMLDLLPKDLFHSPFTKFLDPAAKSGVFLREIAKRLIDGLSHRIPSLQERLDHIFTNQIFGIAPTELTALISRRSLYCSKTANGETSVARFSNERGNIRYVRSDHNWEDDKCTFCGAPQSHFYKDPDYNTYETYAYEFIHTENPEELYDKKFDVIIGNPPFTLKSDMEEYSDFSMKIYHLFIEQALKMKPRFICMITPSEWIKNKVEGIPESWAETVLHSEKFKVLHDFENSEECLPGVKIDGGVNYFLWDADYRGKCSYCLHRADTGNTEKEDCYLYEKYGTQKENDINRSEVQPMEPGGDD